MAADEPVASPFDDDTASFRGMGGAAYVEDPAAIEYDGSVFRAKALAARRLPSGEVRQVKSILKTRSEPVPLPRAPFHSSRIRSDSYDPTTTAASGSGGSDPPAMVEAIMASPSQVDGIGGGHSGRPFSPYEQPAYNASAPSLVARQIPSGPHRSVTAPPTERRRIAFAPSLSVHTTWPGDVYNRASEPATCNRLNAELAAAIKAELNSYSASALGSGAADNLQKWPRWRSTPRVACSRICPSRDRIFADIAQLRLTRISPCTTQRLPATLSTTQRPAHVAPSSPALIVASRLQALSCPVLAREGADTPPVFRWVKGRGREATRVQSMVVSLVGFGK